VAQHVRGMPPDSGGQSLRPTTTSHLSQILIWHLQIQRRVCLPKDFVLYRGALLEAYACTRPISSVKLTRGHLSLLSFSVGQGRKHLSKLYLLSTPPTVYFCPPFPSVYIHRDFSFASQTSTPASSPAHPRPSPLHSPPPAPSTPPSSPAAPPSRHPPPSPPTQKPLAP
jgi:hypothetical protein